LYACEYQRGTAPLPVSARGSDATAGWARDGSVMVGL
jgi:hypothetical protein